MADKNRDIQWIPMKTFCSEYFFSPFGRNHFLHRWWAKRHLPPTQISHRDQRQRRSRRRDWWWKKRRGRCKLLWNNTDLPGWWKIPVTLRVVYWRAELNKHEFKKYTFVTMSNIAYFSNFRLFWSIYIPGFHQSGMQVYVVRHDHSSNDPNSLQKGTGRSKWELGEVNDNTSHLSSTFSTCV